MTALQKKIVVDERGQPLEVIISWAQYCELREALGLDLEVEAIAGLREARAAWERGDQTEFVSLAEL